MELESVCLQKFMGVVHLKWKYLHGELGRGLLWLISCLFAPAGLSEMQSSGGFPVCVPELWGHTEELNKEHLTWTQPLPSETSSLSFTWAAACFSQCRSDIQQLQLRLRSCVSITSV